MRNLSVILGALAGIVIGACSAVILIVATIFVALENERTGEIVGLVTVDYIPGAAGGFDMSVQTGPGLLILVLVGGLLGATSVVLKEFLARESTTQC